MSLVTGGCTARNSADQCTATTDTTELLSAGASAWVYTAPLPSARSYLSGASINNRVIISGEWLYVATVSWEVIITIIIAGGWDGNYLDSILQFDGETQQWKEIGQLRLKRGYHAASIVNINKIAAYLNCD